MHNYHDVFSHVVKSFQKYGPASRDGYNNAGSKNNNGTLGASGYNSQDAGNWSWGAMLLPQLDQAPLFDQLDVSGVGSPADVAAAGAPADMEAFRTPLPAFRCPSDVGPGIVRRGSKKPRATNNRRFDVAISNYVGVAHHARPRGGGNCNANNNQTCHSEMTGMMTHGSRQRKFRDVTDGLSNTIAIGERAYTVSRANAAPLTQLAAIALVQKGCTSATYRLFDTYGFTWGRMNEAVTARTARASFSSMHVGGAHFLLGDGAVRFISENIDHDTDQDIADAKPDSTLERLASIDDGDILGDF